MSNRGPALATSIDAPPHSGATVAELVMSHGGPVSSGLLDDQCHHFRTPGIAGVIGYRRGWGCAVALGDPVCAPENAERLAEAFHASCRARGWQTVYAVASERLAQQAVAKGYAAIEFGEELIFDPRRDPQAGRDGREVRKKIHRATRDGTIVREYRLLREDSDPTLEQAMDAVVTSWLAHRHGPQIYMAHVRLFDCPAGRRWFYAQNGNRVVGALAMLRLERTRGWLLEHLLAVADAPIGTTELLTVEALKTLAADGCAFATFGPAPAPDLGVVQNLNPLAERIARQVYRTASRIFHLEARARYQRKFQVARTEPAFLLFNPPTVGPRAIAGILRAFNVSLA